MKTRTGGPPTAEHRFCRITYVVFSTGDFYCYNQVTARLYSHLHSDSSIHHNVVPITTVPQGLKLCYYAQ